LILHQIFIYLDFCKILLLEKNFTSLEDCKKHLEEFFAIKLGSSERMDFSNCLKGGAFVEKNGEYIIV